MSEPSAPPRGTSSGVPARSLALLLLSLTACALVQDVGGDADGGSVVPSDGGGTADAGTPPPVDAGAFDGGPACAGFPPTPARVASFLALDCSDPAVFDLPVAAEDEVELRVTECEDLATPHVVQTFVVNSGRSVVVPPHRRLEEACWRVLEGSEGIPPQRVGPRTANLRLRLPPSASRLAVEAVGVDACGRLQRTRFTLDRPEPRGPRLLHTVEGRVRELSRRQLLPDDALLAYAIDDAVVLGPHRLPAPGAESLVTTRGGQLWFVQDGRLRRLLASGEEVDGLPGEVLAVRRPNGFDDDGATVEYLVTLERLPSGRALLRSYDGLPTEGLDARAPTPMLSLELATGPRPEIQVVRQWVVVPVRDGPTGASRLLAWRVDTGRVEEELPADALLGGTSGMLVLRDDVASASISARDTAFFTSGIRPVALDSMLSPIAEDAFAVGPEMFQPARYVLFARDAVLDIPTIPAQVPPQAVVYGLSEVGLEGDTVEGAAPGFPTEDLYLHTWDEGTGRSRIYGVYRQGTRFQTVPPVGCDP
jgi:hypothetical protein